MRLLARLPPESRVRQRGAVLPRAGRLSHELIDLGDRLVLLADMPMRAQASGIPLAQQYATVATLERGRVRT